jgi:hypothetical protein
VDLGRLYDSLKSVPTNLMIFKAPIKLMLEVSTTAEIDMIEN